MNRPDRAYLVLTLERSGSSVLCDALERTGVLGTPYELFGEDMHRRATEMDLAAADSTPELPRPVSFPAYVEAVATQTATGGVFGAKVHRNQYLELERRGLAASPLDLVPSECRDRARIVLLTRQDQQRQAISILRARATGLWGMVEDQDGPRMELPGNPYWASRLNGAPDRLCATLDQILAITQDEEQGWRRWIEATGLDVLQVSYEELCDDYAGVVVRVASHTGGSATSERSPCCASGAARIGSMEGEARRIAGKVGWTVALAGCGVVFAVGCGDGEAPSPEAAAAERQAVVEALRSVQRSFRAADRRGLCARMDATARRQAGLVAHGQPDACPQDLGEAFAVIDSGGGLSGGRGSRVVATVVTGDVATATIALGGHERVDIPLTRSDGTWRLATFFGTPPRRASAASIASRTAPFPPARRSVAVAERPGLSCLPLFADDYPVVAGGCELRAAAPRVELTIGTAFGSFRFGECEMGYRVSVDDRGQAWTDSFELRGVDNSNNGCSDVQACEDRAGRQLPWRGRISATGDGRFAHRMDVCLDTCIGFYAGPLTVGLSRQRRGWRATAAAGVGKSGLRFHGRIPLDTGGFVPRPARR